jgi:hypothetical protein
LINSPIKPQPSRNSRPSQPSALFTLQILDLMALDIEYWRQCPSSGVCIIQSILRGDESLNARLDRSIDCVLLGRLVGEVCCTNDCVLPSKRSDQLALVWDVADLHDLAAAGVGGAGAVADEHRDGEGWVGEESASDVVADVGASGLGSVSQYIHTTSKELSKKYALLRFEAL